MSDEPHVGTFGFKCAWFAIRSRDPEAVACAFGAASRKVSWADGCAAAYGGGVFVTQALGEWVLVAGTSLWEHISGKRGDDLVSPLRRLSKQFGEAQYFGTDRVIGLLGYGLARDGDIVRAWATLDGNRFLDEGAPTDAEKTGYVVT